MFLFLKAQYKCQSVKGFVGVGFVAEGFVGADTILNKYLLVM
jgi:hypothetical protein